MNARTFANVAGFAFVFAASLCGVSATVGDTGVGKLGIKLTASLGGS